MWLLLWVFSNQLWTNSVSNALQRVWTFLTPFSSTTLYIHEVQQRIRFGSTSFKFHHWSQRNRNCSWAVCGFWGALFFVTVVESYISYSQGLSSDDSFTSCSWNSVTVVYHADTGFSFSLYLIWQLVCLSELFTDTTSGFPVARLRIPFPAKGSQAMWRRLHLLVIKVFPSLTTLNCVWVLLKSGVFGSGFWISLSDWLFVPV